MGDFDKELKDVFEADRESFAIQKQVVLRWVCKTCGKVHRQNRGYAWCRENRNVENIFKKWEEVGYPTWEKNGTRENITENYRWLALWNWSSLQYKIINRDKYTCQDCGVKGNAIYFEVHHIIPRYSGGSDHPKNLKTLCQECHRKYTNDLLKNKDAYHPNQRSIPPAPKVAGILEENL
jgi:hypothetical protein